MENASSTGKRVTFYLEQMKKAMPEINRQIEVYEKSIKTNKQAKSPKVVLEYKNV